MSAGPYAGMVAPRDPFINAGGSLGPVMGDGLRVSGDVPNIGGGRFNYELASREMSIPSSHGHVVALSNTFIQYSYTLAPWADGSEEHIMEYQLVFSANHMDRRHNLSAIVTIGQLNCIIKKADDQFKKMLANGDGEAAILNNFLTNVADANDALEAYHAATVNQKDDDFLNALVDGRGGLAEAYRISLKDIYLYQSAFGIKQRWNFLGVTLSKLQATSLNSISLDAGAEHVHVLNVILGERARVHNYWGTKKDTWNGSRLHLFLAKKAPTAAFEWQTYASREQPFIPDTVLYPGDDADDLKRYGVVTRVVGTVTEHSEQDPHEGARQQALGATSEQAAYESVARLPFLWVQLGI